uniref:Nuclear receptor domain-containing protein n=1 Tax=Heligmosomoides polygyrus TaxID=6339 RepID=A0A183F7G6_HELPZ
LHPRVLFEECLDWPARTPSPNRQCTICGAPSSGYHFNAPSCSACAAFFRFVYDPHLPVHARCISMRIICRACRYAKCIRMGMERQGALSLVRIGRTFRPSSTKFLSVWKATCGRALSRKKISIARVSDPVQPWYVPAGDCTVPPLNIRPNDVCDAKTRFLRRIMITLFKIEVFSLKFTRAPNITLPTNGHAIAIKKWMEA